MKYVYILVGSSNGFYFEQTLVSLTSLKYVSPSAFVTLLLDDVTNGSGNPLLSQIQTYVDECIVENFEESVSSIARSRILKTTMRSLIKGDFLYIDSDTVWASPVEESIFTEDVMGVLDGHCLLSEHPLKAGIYQDFERTRCNPNVNQYVNGGFLFVKDSQKARNFFKLWHEKWLETSLSGCFIDMPALNFAFRQIYGENLPLLPGYYNAQVSRSWKYFPKAKLIHFFTGWMQEQEEKPYLFQNKFFWKHIKERGLDEYVLSAVKNPLEAFEISIQIYKKVDLELKKTATYGLIRDMFERKIRGEKSKFDLLESFVTLFLQFFSFLHFKIFFYFGWQKKSK